MPKLMIALGVLALIVGFVMTHQVGGMAYHRYRLEIELAGPNGAENGSVVQEVQFTAGTASGLDNFTYLNVYGGGQALVMRPHAGGELIALMANVDEDRYWHTFFDACGFHHDDQESPVSFVSRIASFEGSCDVPQAEQPRYIYLSNPSDPATAQLLTPANFQSVVGSRLASVRMVMTQDPVSTDINDKLGWLDNTDWRNVLPGIKIGRETVHVSAFLHIGPKVKLAEFAKS